MSSEYGEPGSGSYVAAATSCSLRSARITSGLTHFCLWLVSGFSWLKFLMGMFHLFPLCAMSGRYSPGGRTHGSAPYDDQVECVALDCVIVPTVSCCLRQPRITFGATRFGRFLQVCTSTMPPGNLLSNWNIPNSMRRPCATDRLVRPC